MTKTPEDGNPSGASNQCISQEYTVAKVDSTSCFYVYVHRRATDGRVFYVGKGKGRRAWVEKGRSASWKDVVSQHGYTIDIVQNHMQEWWAFELEIELIAFYGKENLTNITAGGQGCSGTKMKPEIKEMLQRRLKEIGVRDSTKEKLRLHNLGKKASEETKRKISIANIGRKHKPESIANMRKGQSNRSEETRRKLGDARRGLKRPQHVIDAIVKRHSKPVICNETGDSFSCCVKAAEWLRTQGYGKAQGRPISDSAKGKYKTAYGHSWRYA